MSIEDRYENSIISRWFLDENDRPYAKLMVEQQQVSSDKNLVQLTGTPETYQGVTIVDGDNMMEVDNLDDVYKSENNYYITKDGLIYFHPNLKGRTLEFRYNSLGVTLLSTNRIFYKNKDNVVRILQELIDKGYEGLRALELFGDSVTILKRLEKDIETGTILHENLLEDIRVGTPLNTNLKENIQEGNTLLPSLVDANNTATQKKKDLDQSIDSATDTNTTLSNTNQSATQTNLVLQQTIASGKDSVDKINATGNKSLIIGASQFVNNEYTWTHNMNSKELHVVMYDSLLDELLFPDCKIIDKNNILIRNSAEHPNIKVVLSASYYQGNALFGTNVEEFASDSIGVNTKKVRLKDGNGIVENPVTDSDAVFMPDGTTKLTKKIDDINKRINENTIEIGNIINEKNKKDFFNIIKNSKSKLIGHRGLGHIYPENTAFAVEKAFEIGMFGVEVDIYQTRDGEFVIIHDDTLDRTTNGTGSVENLNYDYISSLKIDGGNGNPSYYTDLKIPKIEDLLKILQRYNKYLFLELKGTIYNYDKLFAIMDKYKVRDKVVFLSFNYTLLSEIRNKDKNIMLGYNANISNSNIDNCIVLGNSFISTPTSYVTEDLIKYAHNNNVAIISYSATSIMQFRDQMDLGVDLMTTDFLIEGGDF